jgi:hypothetical protein
MVEDKDKEELKKLLERNFLARKVKTELEEILVSRDYFKEKLDEVKRTRQLPDSISGIMEQAFRFGRADGAITKLINYLIERGIAVDSAKEVGDYYEGIAEDAYYAMGNLGLAINDLIKEKCSEKLEKAIGE